MAKGLRERVGKQYTGTQRTRNAVHGECTVELAKWTFPIISRSREPYEAKVSRTGLTGGMGRRTVRQRALCLPSKHIEVQARPAGTKGFTPLEKRWVMERTHAWQSRCRRNSKDYEYSVESSTAMIQISHIPLMLNRLAPCGRPVFHYRKDAA